MCSTLKEVDRAMTSRRIKTMLDLCEEDLETLAGPTEGWVRMSRGDLQDTPRRWPFRSTDDLVALAVRAFTSHAERAKLQPTLVDALSRREAASLPADGLMPYVEAVRAWYETRFGGAMPERHETKFRTKKRGSGLRPWDPSKENCRRYAELRNKGLCNRDIAGEMGIKLGTAHKLGRRYVRAGIGEQRVGRGKRRREQEVVRLEAMIKAYKAGEPVEVIAKREGIRPKSVYTKMERAGIYRKSIQIVINRSEMIETYKSGENIKTIAARFKVSKQTVYSVMNRHGVYRQK